MPLIREPLSTFGPALFCDSELYVLPPSVAVHNRYKHLCLKVNLFEAHWDLTVAQSQISCH